jgi:hypothetical protein
MSGFFSKPIIQQPKRPLSLHLYQREVDASQLVPGIDNVRHDVAISPKFAECCRNVTYHLVLHYSDIAMILPSAKQGAAASARKEFKLELQRLLSNLLEHANSVKNPQLELLATAAVVKFLGAEMQSQFSVVVLQCREKLREFQNPRHLRPERGYQFQEKFSEFQKNKRIILRHVGDDLGEMIEEVRSGSISRTRESYFGVDATAAVSFFSNPLLFTEDGRDDYLNLDRYVMLGKFQRDTDRFEIVAQLMRNFVEWCNSDSEEASRIRRQRASCAELKTALDVARSQLQDVSTTRRIFPLASKSAAIPDAAEVRNQVVLLEQRQKLEQDMLQRLAAQYSNRLDQICEAPENAGLLVDYVHSERLLEEENRRSSTADAILLQSQSERQRVALDHLYDTLAKGGVLPYILASYETARIYPHFCPPINPQQLKTALVDAAERKKLLHLLQEYRLPASATDMMEEAARRLRDANQRDVRLTLIRFVRDFFQFAHDLRNLRLAQAMMDRVHLPTDPKQQELSEINDTLYQFLLPEEEKPREGKISSHAILKADVRSSSIITAELLARGLNPASYFSLNFFEPVRKLLARYGATQVFLEGDAMILAIMENEGDVLNTNSVARTCSLARDIIEGIRGVNERATVADLPLLELGIGISFQPSPPMYLMDGDRPIMISRALNESDRLSSCGKLAREMLANRNRFFNVFVMQLLPESDSRGAAEEFRVHYNVQGIEINEAAFDKLSRELSMVRLDMKLPLIGDAEIVELYCGSLSIGSTGLQRLVVRKGRVPQLSPKDLKVVDYTDRCYYEVCTAKPLYEYVTKQLNW